eukprot:418557-Pyramimonas_sp.AAC.1
MRDRSLALCLERDATTTSALARCVLLLCGVHRNSTDCINIATLPFAKARDDGGAASAAALMPHPFVPPAPVPAAISDGGGSGGGGSGAGRAHRLQHHPGTDPACQCRRSW